MAIAAAPEVAEGLSPEASEAVSAAAAGHGRRLSPEVAAELRRRASRKAKAASSPAKSSDGNGSSSDGGSAAAGAFSKAARTVSTRPGRQGILARVIFATILGLLALEVASQATGRYIDWSFGKGAKTLGQAAGTVGLTPASSGSLAPGTQAYLAQLQQAQAQLAHPTPGVTAV